MLFLNVSVVKALIWIKDKIKRRDYYVCRPMTASHGS